MPIYTIKTVTKFTVLLTLRKRHAMAKSQISTTAEGVGKEILAYCTSCKMDLAHLVVAMKGDQAAKVECKTCKKTHAFKAPKGITEPAKKPAKKSRAKKGDEEMS